jgi:hypothetical protein
MARSKSLIDLAAPKTGTLAMPPGGLTPPAGMPGVPGAPAQAVNLNRAFRLVARWRDWDGDEHKIVTMLEPGSEASIGSGKDCDPKLENLPKLVATIAADPAQGFILRSKEPDSVITVNGQEQRQFPALLRNGDEIRIGEYTVRFLIELESVITHDRNVGILSKAVPVMLGIVVFVELLLVFGLTQRLARSEGLGRDIARARTVSDVDDLRGRIAGWPEEQRNTESVLTLELISGELDLMAQYIRQHNDALTDSQVTELARDLQSFHDILDRLASGVLYPKPEIIETEPALRQLLN